MTEPADPVTPAELRRAFLAHLDGDLLAAEAVYRRALGVPHMAASAHRHLIGLLEAQHRWEDAVDACRAALAGDRGAADLKANLANLLLGLARFAEAWPLLEARALLPTGSVRPSLPYPEWDGSDVRSLTVWDEQGFGDAIQHARFVPTLLARGIEVTLVMRPELCALFAGLGATVIPAEGQLRVPAADAWTMIGSLAGRLGVTLETLAGAQAYLAAPTDRRAKWAGRIGPAARIGVVARGKAIHPNDAQRSLPYEGADFLQSLPAAVSLEPDGPLPLADFADTAAVIEQLDLVIAVDTAVAHLAGALGKPCWVLLPYLGLDWRWLYDGRTDSPWYPSLRIYRQPAPRDWASVLRAIARDLPAFFGQA
ncbi:MAG TPA: glycosyltransferase family 9 protein [Phenylobacterium sp.]|jgi:hypothetical protein